MSTKYPLNLAIFGNESSGKSTLVNTMIVKKYEVKQETHQPIVYTENKNDSLAKPINRVTDIQIHKDVYLTLTLYPTCNNNMEKEQYQNFLNERFHNYNIVIYVIDINNQTENDITNITI